MLNKSCLLLGTPRGYTRSVLEALLKKGSQVILTCEDEAVGRAECKRLRSLYGEESITFSKTTPFSTESLASIFKEAVKKLPELELIVNSTANNPVKLKKTDIKTQLDKLELDVDRKVMQEDVTKLKLVHDLSERHFSIPNGGSGVTLLHLSGGTELSDRGGGQCTVLGTTRGLGLRRRVETTGVKPISVYQPLIDYPDLSMACQITDDAHSPYTQWNRYSAYIRDYTGYMTLHLADYAAGGSVWKFNDDSKVSEVQPMDLGQCCHLSNKMCFWLGCPKVSDVPVNLSSSKRDIQQQVEHREDAVQNTSHEIR